MLPILINDVPLPCINQAAIHYLIPAPLIIAVLKTENGKNGMASQNKNGTVDLGVMQINSSWLPTLAHFGYTAKDVQFNRCKNVDAGAWILSSEMKSTASIWRGVGDYHSHTPNKNNEYVKLVSMRYQSIVSKISD